MTVETVVTRTGATLRIAGATLDVDDVTSRLGISPSDSFKAGDRHGKDGRLVWKHGHWALTSEGSLASTDLEEHVAWVLDQIEPVSEQLNALMQQPGVKADLFCFLESESVNFGVELSPSIMGRAAALDLSIDIDIYFAF